MLGKLSACADNLWNYAEFYKFLGYYGSTLGLFELSG